MNKSKILIYVVLLACVTCQVYGGDILENGGEQERVNREFFGEVVVENFSHAESFLSSNHKVKPSSDAISLTLENAASEGRLAHVRFIMNLGGYIRPPQDGVNLAFRSAASAGHLEIVRFFMGLGEGVRPDQNAVSLALECVALRVADSAEHMLVFGFLWDIPESRGGSYQSRRTIVHHNIASYSGGILPSFIPDELRNAGYLRHRTTIFPFVQATVRVPGDRTTVRMIEADGVVMPLSQFIGAI